MYAVTSKTDVGNGIGLIAPRVAGLRSAPGKQSTSASDGELKENTRKERGRTCRREIQSKQTKCDDRKGEYVNMEDKFMLGGKEFQEPFYFRIRKIQPESDQGSRRTGWGRDHHPCAYAVQIHRKVRISWTISRRELRCFLIPPVQEMRRRLCGSQD